MKPINPFLLATLLAFASACSKETTTQDMPDVNDENCKPEVIKNINDKGAQQEFASKCLHRSGGFKPSQKRQW
jgi:entry exclusion lipoprotein TrbK